MDCYGSLCGRGKVFPDDVWHRRRSCYIGITQRLRVPSKVGPSEVVGSLDGSHSKVYRTRRRRLCGGEDSGNISGEACWDWLSSLHALKFVDIMEKWRFEQVNG